MLSRDKYLGIYFWAWSLLLKSGILAFGCVAVLWAGWPQPSSTPRDHFSSRSESTAVQGIQHELPLVSSISNNASLRASQQEVILQTVEAPLFVNLNGSSQKELESLPGIGKVLAGRIVTYRSTYGAFQRVDDVVKVSGIGEKRLQQLLPYVTVEAIIDN